MVIGGPVSELIGPMGNIVKTGKGPVLVGIEWVGKVGVVDGGGVPKVIPSIVVAPVGYGNVEPETTKPVES